MTNIKKWEDNDHWVEIDLDLCIGAGDCIEVCPVDVYDFLNNKVDAENIGECTDCMACQDVCPNDAILKHSAWS
ncbi:MAG: ferredoxin family protein [Candidatus Lokiarchaeota archaeon]|nr:ferredoxin family protein [Candidatus Lokiarchaeota archaeon]